MCQQRHWRLECRTQHTSQSDEKPARKGTRVVLNSGEARRGYAPEKSTAGEHRDHACALSKQSERHHCSALAQCPVSCIDDGDIH